MSIVDALVHIVIMRMQSITTITKSCSRSSDKHRLQFAAAGPATNRPAMISTSASSSVVIIHERPRRRWRWVVDDILNNGNGLMDCVLPLESTISLQTVPKSGGGGGGGSSSSPTILTTLLSIIFRNEGIYLWLVRWLAP
jgi:hypothetical protein